MRPRKKINFYHININIEKKLLEARNEIAAEGEMDITVEENLLCMTNLTSRT
jgi:hypothetical protein